MTKPKDSLEKAILHAYIEHVEWEFKEIDDKSIPRCISYSGYDFLPDDNMPESFDWGSIQPHDDSSLMVTRNESGRIIDSLDGSDECLDVSFSLVQVSNKLRTHTTKIPQFDFKHFVHIRRWLDNSLSIDAEMTEYYAWRFGPEYKVWLKERK